MFRPIDTTKQSPEQRMEELQRIKRPPQFESKIDFDKSQALDVPVGCYAVTRANSSQPIVGSWGAGPCLIVVLHDPTTFTVAAHFYQEDPKFLCNFLDNMNIPTVEAHLTGTALVCEKDCKTPSKALETYYLLESYGVKKIINTDIAREFVSLRFDQPASLAFDARTGVAYSPVLELNFGAMSKMQISKIDSDFSFRRKKTDKDEIKESPKLEDEKLKKAAAVLVGMTAIPDAVMASRRVAETGSNPIATSSKKKVKKTWF